MNHKKIICSEHYLYDRWSGNENPFPSGFNIYKTNKLNKDFPKKKIQR